MRVGEGGLVYSPSDLTEFRESEFASWMSRLRVENPERIAPREDCCSGPVKGIDEILDPPDLDTSRVRKKGGTSKLSC